MKDGRERLSQLRLLLFPKALVPTPYLLQVYMAGIPKNIDFPILW